FTLIEIMVVVIVLAIMASLIVPQFGGAIYDGKVSKARSDIKNLENALERYYLRMDKYPTTEQGLRALVEAPADAGTNWGGPYLKRLEKDAWEQDYQYRSPGEESRPYDIWSQGADGQDGGEGKDADITNWREEGGA
ncbi:MAG: type II secretion system major pseudopilin GspG, partial [Planctomycetota bacterium]